MRDIFAQTLIQQCNTPSHFFLTGDLGFMALEGVRDAFSDRFVNVGISEQNMIGVAAALAYEGFTVFAYSIAPFCYARPFEQIRNDVCFGNLTVCLVGNGGGYAYGYMGPTHHALEDCAAMCALGVRTLVPAFDEDISPMLRDIKGPTYLRLGYQEIPINYTFSTHYAPIRALLTGECGHLFALGPLAGIALKAFYDMPEQYRPTLWAITELPLDFSKYFSQDTLKDIAQSHVVILEEHVQQGGLGVQICYFFALQNIVPKRITHRYALRYPSRRYGSQGFHRKECGLDVKSIQNIFYAREKE